MRGWKFWDKTEDQSIPPTPAVEPPRRFSARPRTDTLTPHGGTDPATEGRLAALLKRREAVRFDVEQALQANEPENPWMERVRLLDQAISAARADRDRAASHRESAGAPLPTAPISELQAIEGPPPRVSFRIGDESFLFEEELDWAERGFQIARGELLRREGDPSRLVPASLPAEERVALSDHLERSLFAFASDVRDRALASTELPAAPSLSDLARPDPENGGWLDWSGHSPLKAARELGLGRIDAEIERLSNERARELAEVQRWADRLPIAQRRMADVEAEIASLGG